MRAFDLTPLFRSSVGYDRLSRLMDSASRVDEAQLAYPPYNIEQAGEDSPRGHLAEEPVDPGDHLGRRRRPRVALQLGAHGGLQARGEQGRGDALAPDVTDGKG